MALALVMDTKVECGKEKEKGGKMLRLDTVEDFEKIRQALDDPTSKSWQYSIKPYGFCRLCGQVTEFVVAMPKLISYEFTYELQYIVERCLRCGRSFEDQGGFVADLYLLGELVPPEYKERVINLNSQEHQRECFLIALDDQILSLKRKQRQLKNDIRRLAKLRA